MSQAYRVRFNFTPRERLDLRGIIVDACGGRAVAHSWEHAVLEVASCQAAPLMPAILHAIQRGDFEVTGDDGVDPRDLRSGRGSMGVKRPAAPLRNDEPF